MKKEPLYILTYDHGGYVLWNKEVKPRLEKLEQWLEQFPKLKIGLDYESFAFDEYARIDPQINKTIARLLKKYPDRFGLGATTYGQPLSMFISEESNVRQLTYSVRANEQHFGVKPSVYCISEFALHGQIPQLIAGVGYEAAILRSHVMGYGYTKTFDCAWGNWMGKDGTEMPAVPTYHKQGRGFNCTTLDNWILSRWPRNAGYELEDFQGRFAKYTPLLCSRYDDLTQDIEEICRYTQTKDDCEYVLLEDLPDLYGEATEPLNMTDNDFHTQMPWGYCGNEIFNGCRQGEVNALQGEKLNAFSVLLGGESMQRESEEAWKYILSAQHHDVTICGLLDLARRFIPSSLAYSDCTIKRSLQELSKHFAHEDSDSVLLVNPHAFPIDTWVRVPVEKACAVASAQSETADEHDGNYLHVRAVLPPLTAQSFALTDAENETACAFIYNENSGELLTDLYRLQLNENGIVGLWDRKTDRLLFGDPDGALLSAVVDGEDRNSNGTWSVTVHPHCAVCVQNGYIGAVRFVFEMRFYEGQRRIDCKTTFEIHGNKVGRDGITQGRPASLTVDGHHHEDKLCFVAACNLSRDRKMLRDVPFGIAEWDGQLRKTEGYWYPDDYILVDTPVSHEESFNATTYMSGTYWVALRDAQQGMAVFNKGCMGSAIHGNELRIPLLYANLYLCGTKMLDGIFEDAFALYPFDSQATEADVHKQAMLYNYEPVAHLVKKGKGTRTAFTAADIEQCDNGIILTAMYPENGHILMRFCNYSDEKQVLSLRPAVGTVTAETDLLGNIKSETDARNITFGPWQIRTLRIETECSASV